MAVTARKRTDDARGNRIGVWMYRTLDGRFSSGSKDVHVLMLTSPGRRTGLPRSTCVRYLETPEGLLVWGTGSGSPRPGLVPQPARHPDRDGPGQGPRHGGTPRELHAEERDTVWRDVVLAGAPEVSRFASEAGRVIPVAVLRPLGRGGSRP